MGILASDIGNQFTDIVVEDSLIVDIDEGEGTTIGTRAANDFGWRDMEGPIVVRGIGGSTPTWSQVGTTAFRQYQFAVNDECWINFHLPHDYVPESSIHIHAHWITDGTNTAVVKWEWDLAYADGYGSGVFPLGSPTTISAEEAAAGVAYTHHITETAAIDMTGAEVDGLLSVHIKRVTNGGTDNTDGVFLLTSDIHYQSTNFPTKNKNPNFYT